LLATAAGLAAAAATGTTTRGEAVAEHVVLLGDSVLDNGAYVAGGPDVVAQLRPLLPAGWRATLLAVDGAVTADVARQLGRLPPDASRLVVSVGGNDALGQAGVLDEGARSVAEALDRWPASASGSGGTTRRCWTGSRPAGVPAAVCTIYDGRLPDPRRRRLATTALATLNDVITREAFRRGLPLHRLAGAAGRGRGLRQPDRALD
jgi:hypothetical protein